MKSLYWQVAILGLLSHAVGSAEAGTITVANPSFESPTLSSGGSTSHSIPNWTTNDSGSYGVLYPTSFSVNLPVPDGHQVAYAGGGNDGGGGSFGQDTGVAVVPGTTYTLSVDVGSVKYDDTESNYFVKLYSGSTLLGSKTGSLSQGNGNFSLVTLTATAPSNAHGDLIIQLGDSGTDDWRKSSESVFDKVLLDPPAVPEPSTLLMGSLAGSLGLGAAWFRRRRSASN